MVKSTQTDIKARFEAVSDDFIQFDQIPPQRRRSSYRDIHALLLLTEASPGKGRFIACAEHDQIWFDFPRDEMDDLSDEDIFELTRCGIFYDDDVESFSMFV